MKKTRLLGCLMLCSSAAFAQALPEPLAGIAGQGKPLLKREEISAEQRAYLWAGTTAERGYFTVQHSAAYVRLVDSMIEHGAFVKRAGAPQGPGGIAEVGMLDEGNHRVTRVYSADKAMAAVTRFNTRAAGASVTIADEFLNQRMMDFPASLALVVAPGTDKGLWKLTVFGDGLSYEVYIPDVLDGEGRPRSSPGAVLALAGQLIARANEN